MLQFINDSANAVMDFIKDDPVRPDLSKDFRITRGRLIAALIDDANPDAITCVSFHNTIPADVEALDNTAISESPSVAVFYTIWSYKPGTGVTLLLATVDEIKRQFPTVTRFVTLSPKTEMARRFHLKNGATIFRENETSVNYEYPVAAV